MTIELENFRVEKKSLVAILIDDVDIGIIRKDSANEIAVFEVEVGRFGGKDGKRR